MTLMERAEDMGVEESGANDYASMAASAIAASGEKTAAKRGHVHKFGE